jgi:hypothetical protein
LFLFLKRQVTLSSSQRFRAVELLRQIVALFSYQRDINWSCYRK